MASPTLASSRPLAAAVAALASAPGSVGVAGLLAVSGAAALVEPALLSDRFVPTGTAVSADDFALGALALAPALGSVALVAAVGVLAWTAGLRWASPVAQIAAASALVSACFLALTAVFADWHIDDAAITYAYAENLVRGHGLVLHPSQAPEEAYSNSLWLLILAGARALGASVHGSAKVLSALLGIATVAGVFATLRSTNRAAPSGVGVALVGATLLATPFAVWSTSGLEHALQGLLFVAIVAHASTPAADEGRLGWPTAALCALVLLRPEAPLVVAAVALAYGARAWQRTGHAAAALGAWPLAVAPAATLGALLLFRWLYFEQLLPNPYYAKATEATPLRLLNVVGGGWHYVLGWLRDGGALALLPVLLLARWHRAPFALWVVGAIVSAQLAFVVSVGGDWMGAWRFLCALIPLLAIAVGWALADLESRELGAGVGRVALLCCGVLVWCNAMQLAAFRGHPTTPADNVARIGLHFVDLAQRLGIDAPRLAHHDAGGTSYVARIDLLDLGGLGSRDIALRRDDPERLRRYILEEQRPDFVFGSATTFAAGWSGFHRTEAFQRDYVRLVFPGERLMRGALCHVRRDRVREGPGLVVEHEDGRVSGLRVEARAEPATVATARAS